MNPSYVYVKRRAEFGKQCVFDDCGPSLDESIQPDPELANDYVQKSPCHRGVGERVQLALHEAQTFHDGGGGRNSGALHVEGGWPREINPRDDEATARYRRRVEKGDDWAPKLRGMLQRMEHCVAQNNAIDIYENYFDEMIPTPLARPPGLRTVNVYADPQFPARPVNDISWSTADSGRKMVVSYYCFAEIRQDWSCSQYSYVWEIENPNVPCAVLKAPCPVVVTEFNPRLPSTLASGLESGQVCSWDVRTRWRPVQTSHAKFSHRDPVTAIKWTTAKSNAEFFSGSCDGRVLWWDTRMPRRPTEVLQLDRDGLATESSPVGVTSMNFEPTMGAKFLLGLEDGTVVCGTRRARTAREKLSTRFPCHHGPVFAVDRNRCNPKLFLTVGDWTARVWTEDAKEGCLASTRFYERFLTGGCWSTSRCSVFYVTRGKGRLDAWDLLVGSREPAVSIQLCEKSLTSIAPHENGSLTAIGSAGGNVYLVEASEALSTIDRNERADFTAYIDRCSRYAKATDARSKEIKLARRMTLRKEESAESIDASYVARSSAKMERIKAGANRRAEGTTRRETAEELSTEDIELLKTVEAEFFEIVKKEKAKYISRAADNPEEQGIFEFPGSSARERRPRDGGKSRGGERGRNESRDKRKKRREGASGSAERREEGEIVVIKKSEKLPPSVAAKTADTGEERSTELNATAEEVRSEAATLPAKTRLNAERARRLQKLVGTMPRRRDVAGKSLCDFVSSCGKPEVCCGDETSGSSWRRGGFASLGKSKGRPSRTGERKKSSEGDEEVLEEGDEVKATSRRPWKRGDAPEKSLGKSEMRRGSANDEEVPEEVPEENARTFGKREERRRASQDFVETKIRRRGRTVSLENPKKLTAAEKRTVLKDMLAPPAPLTREIEAKVDKGRALSRRPRGRAGGTVDDRRVVQRRVPTPLERIYKTRAAERVPATSRIASGVRRRDFSFAEKARRLDSDFQRRSGAKIGDNAHRAVRFRAARRSHEDSGGCEGLELPPPRGFTPDSGEGDGFPRPRISQERSASERGKGAPGKANINNRPRGALAPKRGMRGGGV